MEIAAHPPDPLKRLSLKYWMKAVFGVQMPLEYEHGKPLELKDGSEVRGLDNKPSVALSMGGGEPGPEGVA